MSLFVLLQRAVSRVFHLLRPAELRASVHQFFRWLQPDGRVFISVSSWAPDQICTAAVARVAAARIR